MEKITVKQILIGWLKEHGYDGLCGCECGCGLDDLWPCNDYAAECMPAYKVSCPPEYVKDLGEMIFWPEKTPPTTEDFSVNE